MDDDLLLGMWRYVLPIPPQIWQRVIKGEADLGFMSPNHHRVRNLVVKALPDQGKPLPPEWICDQLGLPLPKVRAILDELERNMTFIYRNPQGEVVWAYPVTTDPTPHRLSFSTGEQIYAAGAFDAIAAPFVQGRLRNDHLSVTVETECGHCRQPLRLSIDSELNFEVLEGNPKPLVYAPMIMDLRRLDEPSIIDKFGRKSIFFWSEEHAREYRSQHGGERGIYASLTQCALINRRVQSAMFGFRA